MIDKKIIIALIAVAAVTGTIALGASYVGVFDDEEEEMGIYDNIPENNNMVAQIDAIGLVQDDITRDIANELGTEIGDEEEGFYDDELEDWFEVTNEEIDTELAEEGLDEVEFEVQDINNVVMFADVPYLINPDLDPMEIEEDTEFGALIDTSISDEDMDDIIQNIEENEEDLVTQEYGDYTIYGEEPEFGSAFYMTVLGDGLIVVSDNDEVVENVIDTREGEIDSVDRAIVPEPRENTYLSVGVSDVEQYFEEFQDEMAEVYEEFEEDFEGGFDDGFDFEDYEGDLSEEEIEELESINDGFDQEDIEDFEAFLELPAPHTITMQYHTDGSDELNLVTSFTLDTQDAVSEYDRLFEEQDEDIEIDITIDSTTIVVTQSTTSDVVVDEMIELYEQLEEFEQQFGGEPSGPPGGDFDRPESTADVEFEETSSGTVEVSVTALADGSVVSVQPDNFDAEVTPSPEFDSDENRFGDADGVGQVVTVSGLEEGDVIFVSEDQEGEDIQVQVEEYRYGN